MDDWLLPIVLTKEMSAKVQWQTLKSLLSCETAVAVAPPTVPTLKGNKASVVHDINIKSKKRKLPPPHAVTQEYTRPHPHAVTQELFDTRPHPHAVTQELFDAIVHDKRRPTKKKRTPKKSVRHVEEEEVTVENLVYSALAAYKDYCKTPAHLCD
jgi:hypothetical protein